MAWRGRFQTREKAPRDLVTDADFASEQAVRRVIAEHFPDHGILGEEAAVMDATRPPLLLGRRPARRDDQLRPWTSLLRSFGGRRPEGPTSRGGRLRSRAKRVFFGVGRRWRLAQWPADGRRAEPKPSKNRWSRSVFRPGSTTNSLDLRAFMRVGPVCQAMRRTGSAALNLAYVACGRLDAHWAHEIHPWDAAAGVLLVREAGGAVSAADGKPFDLARADYLAASTAKLHERLLPLIG